MTDPVLPALPALPALDASAEEELGVVLLGLDSERLLAGLALCRGGLADDPALVVLTVDRARHDVVDGVGLTDLAALGAVRWWERRPALSDAGLRRAAVGSVRHVWSDVSRHVGAVTDAGSAERIHLTACWLRRAEVDAHPGGRSCRT